MRSLFSDDDKKQSAQQAIEVIRRLIGDSGWFIAGSFADVGIKNPSDIDIFFHTEEAYNDAYSRIKAASDNVAMHVGATKNASTAYLKHVRLPIQLVKKHFGLPGKIFDTFDLNVCKKAITPQGRRINHPSSFEELKIVKINSGTFSRYFKYMGYKGVTNKNIRAMELVDTYIANSTIVEDYYGNEKIVAPINKLMLTAVCTLTKMGTYAQEQAKIHAPELLI